MTKKQRERAPIGEDVKCREAVSRGYAAGYDGRPRESNPEKEAELQAAWLSGFDRATHF